MKSLLHFSKFLINAIFDFVTKYILKKVNKKDSVDIFQNGNIINFSHMNQICLFFY